jgi:Alanine dehydrogenase/PNT, C-terminal domain
VTSSVGRRSRRDPSRSAKRPAGRDDGMRVGVPARSRPTSTGLPSRRPASASWSSTVTRSSCKGAGLGSAIPDDDYLAQGVITREQLRLMKRNAVLVDVAIDQGGCFETSRPTTHSDPTYEVEWGHPLLRGQHARRSAHHEHSRADQRDDPLCRQARHPRACTTRSTAPRASWQGLNVVAGKVTYEPVARDQEVEYTPACRRASHSGSRGRGRVNRSATPRRRTDAGVPQPVPDMGCFRGSAPLPRCSTGDSSSGAAGKLPGITTAGRVTHPSPAVQPAAGSNALQSGPAGLPILGLPTGRGTRRCPHGSSSPVTRRPSSALAT